MTLTSTIALLGFIGVCFLAAASGGVFRPGEWYETLAKPRWRPPRWVFAPAWSVLYLTIAIAGWLVWRRAGFAARGPLTVYLVSLALNAAWSFCFFGLRRPGLAFADVSALWLSIVATIAVFYPIESRAAFLLVPYLLWVTFAATLNFTIWRINQRPAPA